MKHIREYSKINEKSANNTFVRFGKMAPVKQKGFGKSETFHSPPASRGFYAFPLKFQDLFLAGSIDSTQPKQISLPKEDKYKDEEGEIDWDKWHKKKEERFSAMRHEFKVNPSTELWHHLPVPNNEVVARYGSWVKTGFRVWEKAVSKESVKLRAKSLDTNLYGGKEKDGVRRSIPGGINSVGKQSGFYGIDHFEVFFDTKVT